jgi:Histidine ammonia-lyase
LSFRPEGSASTIWRSACRRGRRARSVVLAARRGSIGIVAQAAGGASAGLRHQYRVRKTGVETHSAGSDDAAAAEPDCVALLRGRAAHARTDRASDDGAEDRLIGAGASGVRREIIEQLQAMLARDLSAGAAAGIGGASGDLAPLAHMTAVMIGEGQALSTARLDRALMRWLLPVSRR